MKVRLLTIGSDLLAMLVTSRSSDCDAMFARSGIDSDFRSRHVGDMALR